MSSPTITNVQPPASTEKKEKKPKLSAKYSKFMVFGYTLVQSLHANGTLTDEGLENAYTQLKLFDSVDDQTALYETIVSQSKETGKEMHKFITVRNKPPKAPKARKSTANNESTDAPKEKKPRQPRAKKTTNVVQDTSNDLISELVAAANEVPTVTDTDTEPVAPKEKKPRKPRAKKAETATETPSTPEPTNVAIAEPVAPKKPRKPRAKKAETATETPSTPEPTNVAVAEPDTEPDTEPVAPKKTRKPRAKKAETATETPSTPEPTNVAVAEEPVAPKKTSKPRAKKAEPAPIEMALPTMTEELEEEEIITHEITIQGTTYLIDDSNNLYSIDTNDEMGTYNPDTQLISHTC